MGVAGIHRLFNRLEEIQKASVIIVIAGMEGALVSVVGGLVDVPRYCRSDQHWIRKQPSRANNLDEYVDLLRFWCNGRQH